MLRQSSITFENPGSPSVTLREKYGRHLIEDREEETKTSFPNRGPSITATCKSHGLRSALSYSELRTMNPIFSAITLPPSCPPETAHEDFIRVLTLIASGHCAANVLQENLPYVSEAQLMSHLAAFGAKSWGATDETIAAEKGRFILADDYINPFEPCGMPAAHDPENVRPTSSPTPTTPPKAVDPESLLAKSTESEGESKAVSIQSEAANDDPLRNASGVENIYEKNGQEQSPPSGHAFGTDTLHPQPPRRTSATSIASNNQDEDGFTTVLRECPRSSSNQSSMTLSQAPSKINGSRFSALEVEGEDSEDNVESDKSAPDALDGLQQQEPARKIRNRKRHNKKKMIASPSNRPNEQQGAVDADKSTAKPEDVNRDGDAATTLDSSGNPSDHQTGALDADAAAEKLEDFDRGGHIAAIFESLQILLQTELLIFIFWLIVAYPVKRYLS